MRQVRIDEYAAADDAADGEIGFGDLARGIGRKIGWILGTTLVFLVLSSLAVNLVKPRYTAEAKVFLDSQDDYFTRPDKAAPELQPPLDPEAVQSQVQLVTSRDLARAAIQKLDLLNNDEFNSTRDADGWMTRAMVYTGLARDPREMSPEDRVLSVYYDRLTVYPVAKTRVLSIEFVSRDPEFAARAANTIAELYIAMEEDTKKNNAKAAGAWLAPNIEALRKKVSEAEDKAATFRAQSGLLVGSNNTTISAQQLADLNTQLANARSLQSEAQAKAHLIRDLISEGRVSEISDIANNELIRAISQQSVSLRAQLASESRTLLPGHPRIQELSAQLANVDSALRAAAEKAARGLENDAKVAGARVDAVQASLDLQKKAVATGNSDDVQLRALERDAAAARDQLESFLQKYREASARDTDNAVPASARIISRAIAPELPSFPKKLPTIAIATLAGFLLSLATVVSRELLAVRDEPARSRNAVPRLIEPARRLSALRAESSDLAAREDLAAYAPPTVYEPEVFKERRPGRSDVPDIIGRVRLAKREGQAACVLVCGMDRKSGAADFAVDLARGLADRGRAIVVDFNNGGPGLDRFIADDAAVGLAELVAGRRSFTDAIHRDRGSRLHLLPKGRSHPGDATDAERLELVIDALVATYDFIVLDGAALADSDVSLDLSSWSDIAVLVAPGAGNLDPQVAVDTLKEAGVRDVALVMNQHDVRAHAA